MLSFQKMDITTILISYYSYGLRREYCKTGSFDHLLTQILINTTIYMTIQDMIFVLSVIIIV